MPTHKRVVLLEEFFEFYVMPLAYPLKYCRIRIICAPTIFSAFTIRHWQIDVDSTINAIVN